MALALLSLLGEPWLKAHRPPRASADPSGHRRAGLPGSKGRIQDVAKQKLAGFLVTEDGDGEPQVVDLWGEGAQRGRGRPGGGGVEELWSVDSRDLGLRPSHSPEERPSEKGQATSSEKITDGSSEDRYLRR